MTRTCRALACLLAGTLGLRAAPALAAPARPPLVGSRLPELSLETAGGPLELARSQGRWTWLYLGYTNCPDLCPNTLGWLADGFKRLPPGARPRVLFVSVDPCRDPPARLASYARFFDPAFVGATGPKSTLDQLASAIGFRYELPADARPDTAYAIAHTNAVYLVEPTGQVRASYLPEGEELWRDTAAVLGAPAAVKAAPVAPSRPVLAWCDPSQPDPLMERARAMGSGTSLVPADSPMRMGALQAGDWRVMFHGSGLVGYNEQGGPRGELTWAAENWQMAMATGPVGPGLLDLRLMTSLEPLTLPAGGTPQLLQEGESYHFNPLIDHQHPHDLFMELAGKYTYPLANIADVFLYGGPVGEPALGPVAFMHRPSAADNPWAPLGHHSQDSTHIAYGVATAGARRGPVQLEVSAFNGREPDEFRYDIEHGPWDSYAGRVSYVPDAHWVMQVSHGHLVDPERLHPGNIERTTASIMTVQAVPWGLLSSQLVWGQNLEAHPPLAGLFARESYGLEGQLDAPGGWHAYSRLEILDRDGLPPDPPLNHVLHRVEAFTLGGVKDLDIVPRLNFGLGADLTLYGMDTVLQDVYGYNPVSFRVYLRLQPPMMGWGAPDGMVMPLSPVSK